MAGVVADPAFFLDQMGDPRRRPQAALVAQRLRPSLEAAFDSPQIFLAQSRFPSRSSGPLQPPQSAFLQADSDVKGVARLSYGQLPGRASLIFHFLLAQNLIGAKSIVNVLWSLPFEIQMYVFLPFLFCWSRRKRSAWPLIVLWGACLIPAAAQPHVHALWRLS